MSRSTSRIAIVVVSYNVCDLLRQCLTSATNAELPADVIVVDNASHDGSVTMVEREFPSVRLIANDTNCGFAAGTNQGIRAALESGAASSAPTPEYVLLLNPDAFLRPDAL